MKRLIAIVICLVMLLTGCAELPRQVSIPDNSQGLTVHYLDVGQADSILVQCDGQNLLIDGGNVEDSDLVVAYLLDQNVTTLDYVVNTHAHEDHVGGLPAVLAVFETKEVWCPVESYDSKCFSDFLYYVDQQDLSLVCPAPGSSYPLGGAQITVLGPVEEDYDTNNSSIVLRVDYGSTSFLFTGDAETEAEHDILDAGYNVRTTVLKVGHHGSSTSTGYQWLRETAPTYAVISCGTGNSYGHPHEEVLSRLRDADVTLYRTDLQGHIVCTSDGSQLTFRTEKTAAVTNPTEKTQTLIGNQNSKKFHRDTCSGLPKENNRVYFDSYEDAVEAGFTPCGRCLEE